MALSALAGSLVLEPTAEELEAFKTSPDNAFRRLHAIFKRAGFTWGTKYQHSPGGVLLSNLGSEWVALPGSDSSDPKAPTITIDEFASTPSEELERNIEAAQWKFSKSSEPTILEKEKLTKDELTEAKSMHKTQARKAHQAANLACGLLIPRAVQRAAVNERDEKTDQYRLEKIALLKQQSAHKGNQVAVHEIADVTMVKSIPLMPNNTFNAKFKNFEILMHRPPHSWEECTIQQLIVVEDLLKDSNCYVDLSIFG